MAIVLLAWFNSTPALARRGPFNTLGTKGPHNVKNL